jgi:uncharacterized protein (TIGR02246 family)
MPTADVQVWIDKLEIRELIERLMRYMDDGDGERIAEQFAEDGVLQVAGTVFAGRDACSPAPHSPLGPTATRAQFRT